MDPRVSKLRTVIDCENFERNALRLGEHTLAVEAKRHKVALKAQSYGATSDVERECLEAIYAYEETLFAKNGKRTRARRTWDMIGRRGILPAVERAVNRPTETQGFRALKELGLGNFAFEAVVVRYPTYFSDDVVRISRERMSEWDETDR